MKPSISRIPHPLSRFVRRMAQGLGVRLGVGLGVVLVGLTSPQLASPAASFICFSQMLQVCRLTSPKHGQRVRVPRRLDRGLHKIHMILCIGTKKPGDVLPVWVKVRHDKSFQVEWGTAHLVGTEFVFVFRGNAGVWGNLPSTGKVLTSKYPHVVKFRSKTGTLPNCMKEMEDFRKELGVDWNQPSRN